MFSTVPQVRAALVELFTAALNLPGDPPVLYSDGRDDGDFFVKVGTVAGQAERSIKRMPHTTTSSMDEDYSVEVYIWRILRSRNDSAATREACEAAFAIADRLDAALRADYRLGDLVTWSYFADFTSSDYAVPEGRATDIVTTVTVKTARI